MSSKEPTIDEIKKRYEYILDPVTNTYTACAIFFTLYGKFRRKFKEYQFDENIKKIRKGIDDKGDKIDKNLLQSYDELIKEISEDCEKMKEKVHSYYEEKSIILIEITVDYKENRNKPGAKDIYIKIGKDLIDEGVNIFIKYEKQLILYNDKINEIKQKIFNN